MPDEIHWRLRCGVLVAVAEESPPEPPTAPQRPPLTGPEFARMIACPTCHARVDQMCQTTTGRHREPHASRLVARRCSCGEVLAPGKKVCALCRAEARRINGRNGMRATRARRRAA